MARRRPRPAPAIREAPAAAQARAKMRNLADGKLDYWYRIENNALTGTAELWIYDEIGYYGVSSSDFVRDLQDVRSSDLDVHINSPGGDVFDGVAIFNALRNHPKTVTVHIDGLAASAASFIAMAGDVIKIARNAQVMIHEASGLVVGSAADMAEMARLLDKCSNNIADIYAQRAGGTVAAWRKRMRAETWYSADEAVKAGLADEVHEAEVSNRRAPAQFEAAIRQGITQAEFAAHATTLLRMLKGTS